MKKKPKNFPTFKDDPSWHFRVDDGRATSIKQLVEQFDRIEKVLKWLVIAEHIDKAVRIHAGDFPKLENLVKIYTDLLPDITDILKEKK